MYVFVFNDAATTEIYALSLHDALPICSRSHAGERRLAPDQLAAGHQRAACGGVHRLARAPGRRGSAAQRLASVGCRGLRSEEHTSELQSRQYLVCRILLEKKTLTRTLH